MGAKSDIEERWSQLDPIFIRGQQRTGTSIMARALRIAGFNGFGEGHLWFELAKPLARFRDPEYRKLAKHDSYALGAGRNLILEKYIALAIDRFHRDHLPPHTIRWVDKSPGPDAVEVVPMLAEMFPKAQFIFMYRNGITTVNSALRKWPDNPNTLRWNCLGWAKTMSTWRKVRGLLEGRYIEIAQEELASNPEETAARLTEFLHIPEHREAIAELFRTQRANTAFPDKPPGDYDYEINWSRTQKKYFIQTCGEEMKAWGYSMDLIEPVGPFSGWSRRFRTAWSVLQAEGPLAFLGKVIRFLYLCYVRRVISTLRTDHPKAGA